MFIEAAFAAALIASFWKSSKKEGMTVERRKAYESAMENLTDAAKLRELAKEFEKGGCKIEANLLCKRAELREMPVEKKEHYRIIYERAMKADFGSDGKPIDPKALDRLALAFEKLTASGSARNLRKRAKEIRVKRATEEMERRKAEREAYEKEQKRVTQDALEKAREDETVEVSAEVIDGPAVHGEQK